jgi:hypothetical protein
MMTQLNTIEEKKYNTLYGRRIKLFLAIIKGLWKFRKVFGRWRKCLWGAITHKSVFEAGKKREF